MQVREATFDLLRQLELTTVFGNPGSTEQTFLQNFPTDFRYVLALHEASALAIADGYCQATRRPVLVNLHTAAGLGNAMGALATAAQNKTPLLVTAGQQTREMLLLEPWLTNIEPELMPKPWVKWAYEPARAVDVPATFMRAYATAVQPPAGPVFLSLPMDDWDQEALGRAQVRRIAQRSGPDPVALAAFASQLSTANSPALIFGAGVARSAAWPEAVALAEKLQATVWAAPASERTPFPEDHPLYAGPLPFAIAPLADLLRGHDVACVIGAPVFRYYPYTPGAYLPDGLRLLHVTDDPAEAARAPVGDSLIGDAGLTLAALTHRVEPRRRSVATPSLAHRMAPRQLAEPAQAPTDGTLTALELFTTLRASLPADTVLVEESPSNLRELHQAWPVTLPDSFYTFASGGLGWNLPAAVGIALAERDSGRDRPVLAVIGDGSFQYSLQALWTCSQLGLGVLFVVPRNYQYAILKSFAAFIDTPQVPALDIPDFDVVSLAKGYGCTGVRATTVEAVAEVCQESLARSRPTVLEVPISSAVPELL